MSSNPGISQAHGHAACSCSQEEKHAEQTGSVEKKERGGDVWKTMKKNGGSKRKKEAVKNLVNSQGQCDIQKITEKAFKITIKLQNMVILIS